MNENYYVTNEELLIEIMKYKETNIKTQEFSTMIMLIANGVAKKPNFNNYTWKEDMVLESVLTCLKYCKNFDPIKTAPKPPNPFGYLTMIIYQSFVGYLNKQKKHKKIKDELYNHAHIIPWNTAIDYSVIKNGIKGKNEIKTEKEKIKKTEYLFICEKCGCVEKRVVKYDINKISNEQAISVDELIHKCKFCNK